jgi:hypothetical protein
MIIEAVIYGLMPTAAIDSRDKVPPEKMFKKLKTDWKQTKI